MVKNLFLFFNFIFFGLAGFAADLDMTYDRLTVLIQQQKVTSVEKAIALFPESFRSNFALVSNSASLQASTPLFPRAILFGLDAKFVCSFGGHIRLDGYDSLECYQFDQATRRFEFRDIVFPGKTNTLSQPAFSQPDRQALGASTCTSCHSADPRPNWEAYSRWPLAFGSVDDGFAPESWAYLPTAEGKIELKRIKKELISFRKFKAQYKASDRYVQLLFDPSPLAPFSSISKNPDIRFRPNFRLTTLIAQLVAQRNFRKLGEQPRNLKADFLRALGRCGSLSLEKTLQPYFTPFDWTPSFQLHEISFIAQSSGLGPYAYYDGITDINSYTGYEILQEFAQLGQISKTLLDEVRALENRNAYQPVRVLPFVDPKRLHDKCEDLSRLN